MCNDIISDGRRREMKKVLLIMVLFASICLFNNKVLADEKISKATFVSSEWLDGISYVKRDDSYYYFMNARAIRNADSGNIAYCLDPFLNLSDGSSYTGYDNYSSIFNLTQEQWKKINLIAYYGYGYGNHLDDKWISITQMMIWKVVDPNHTFNWIDNVTDRNIIYPYEFEINEIETLLKEHDKLPILNLDDSISINQMVEFYDFNGVVKNFDVKEADSGLEVTIEDNIIKIIAREDGEKKFTLVKNGIYNDKFKYFYSEGSQSIIERGNFDSVEVTYKIIVESGTIIINKVDSITKSNVPYGGSASLSDAIYRVEDEFGNTVGDIDIGEDCIGFLDSLPFGIYKIKEIRSGEGYFIDDNSYSVIISRDNLEVSLTLENEVILSSVLIKKYYGSKDDLANYTMKKEKGIRFDVYTAKGEFFATGTTDDNGELNFKLPYGRYVIKQINSTDGYGKVRDINVVVDEESNSLYEYTLNDLKIDVPDAYIEDSNECNFLSLFFLTLLLGACIFVK